MQSARRVLIVDDSPEDVTAYTRLLCQGSHDTYSILAAATGEEGLRCCEETEPDCVLLDYALNDLTGLEFLQRLPRDEWGLSTPVIALTGRGDESIELKLLEAGASDYLVKGRVTGAQLAQRIGGAIDAATVRQALRARRAELEQRTRQLEQFTYLAAHDLAAPLRTLSWSLDVLSTRCSRVLDDDAMRALGMCLDAVPAMQRMIHDLVEHSLALEDQEVLVVTRAESALSDVLQNLEGLIRELRAVVTHDPLPDVLCRPSQLKRLFQNLIDNALKFHADEPTRVHVSATRAEGRVVFLVHDNGIGISPEFFGKIFRPFHRVNSRRKYPGTGIGLSTCQAIVEANKGSIWVRSELGKGATFYFTVPAARA
jgi:signal transduction histidine kinase